MNRRTRLVLRTACCVALALLGTCIVLVSPALATPPTLVSPVADAQVQTVMPTFSWSLNGAYDKLELEVSSGNALDSEGYFASYAIGGVTTATDTSIAAPADKRLWAGRWYWHMRSFLPGPVAEFSEVASFVIPPKVLAPRIAGRVNAYGVSGGTIAINTNGQFARIRVRGSVAGRSCINQTVGGEQLRTRIGQWYVGGTFYCRTKTKLPPRSVVRIQATLMSAGLSRTTTHVFRTPGTASVG